MKNEKNNTLYFIFLSALTFFAIYGLFFFALHSFNAVDDPKQECPGVSNQYVSIAKQVFERESLPVTCPLAVQEIPCDMEGSEFFHMIYDSEQAEREIKFLEGQSRMLRIDFDFGDGKVRHLDVFKYRPGYPVVQFGCKNAYMNSIKVEG